MLEKDTPEIQNDPVPGRNEHIKGRGRVLTFGLHGEELGILKPSELGIAERHTNGARARLASEKAYQGGPSAADKMDL